MTLDVRTYRPDVTVQAVRVTEENAHEVADWARSRGADGAQAYDGQPAVWIPTPGEGPMTLAQPGDYVAAGTHGPFVVSGDDFPSRYSEEP